MKIQELQNEYNEISEESLKEVSGGDAVLDNFFTAADTFAKQTLKDAVKVLSLIV